MRQRALLHRAKPSGKLHKVAATTLEVDLVADGQKVSVIQLFRLTLRFELAAIGASGRQETLVLLVDATAGTPL